MDIDLITYRLSRDLEVNIPSRFNRQGNAPLGNRVSIYSMWAVKYPLHAGEQYWQVKPRLVQTVTATHLCAWKTAWSFPTATTAHTATKSADSSIKLLDYSQFSQWQVLLSQLLLLSPLWPQRCSLHSKCWCYSDKHATQMSVFTVKRCSCLCFCYNTRASTQHSWSLMQMHNHTICKGTR